MTHVITLNAGSATVKFALFAAAPAGPLLRAGGVAEMLAEGGRLRVKAVDLAAVGAHAATMLAGTSVGRAVVVP